MATAKKSTTKKATGKKKTASVRATTKKTTAKKPAAKQAASSKKTLKQMVTVEKLKKFNFFTAAISAIFAALSALLLSSKSAELYLPYSTKDELASLESTVLGPAYEVIATIELRYILAFIFGLSALFSLLMATSLRAKYEEGLKNKTSVVRWILFGIISALSLEFVSLLAGVSDIVTLKLIAGLVLVAALLGWVSENQNKVGGKNFAPFYLSLFAVALAWLPLVVGLVGTTLYGMQSFEWHVYALAAVLLVGFISLAMTQYRHIKNGANNDQFLQVEGKYVSTDFLIKVAFFIVVFIALFD
jgi:MFS family permease